MGSLGRGEIGGAVSSVDPPVGAGISLPVEVRAAARDGVREVVAAGGAYGRSGRRWVVPLAAASAVAAAACTPVAWPLLAGGALAVPAALAAAFGQVGGVGGALLSEVVIRAWDRLRAGEGSGAGQGELREALATELREALTSSSAAAAGLRAEVAGVLQGVDAVQVALSTTIETTVRESGDQVRAVLVCGLRDLGMQFAEFGWLLEEVNDQITVIAETQTEIAAGSRAILEAQQRTLMQLAVLRQQTRPAHAVDGGSEITGISLDEERAAALEATGVPAVHECPYPGLAAFGPQDADRFFGRERVTAALVTRLAEQLTRPGLLMVLGPSGSGKSSLLRAGLLPGIAAGQLAARGSEAWPVDLMTPGRRPLLELATRIAAVAGIPAGALDADLRADPARITAVIRQALLSHARRQALLSGPGPEAVPVIIDLDAAGMEAVGHEAESGTTAAVRVTDASPGRAVAPPRLVLIVDQFEEVFTQCTDDQERQAFIQALCAAAGTIAAAPLPSRSNRSGGLLSSRDAPALVVIGIRADFYARAAACPELVPYLQDCQVLVGPMDQAGLRAAIEGPAASAGHVVDSGLVEVLLADLGLHPSSPAWAAGEPAGQEAGPEAASPQPVSAGGSYEAGRLPLLAYALQQTWQHREGRRLTVAAYRATGGIDGAVARAAESVYERFDADGRQAARRMLLRLVSIGEGTADTRRRVTVTELTGTPGLTKLSESADASQAAAARVVLTELVQARLLTADTGTDGTDTVEISHEALLSAWPRLREWLSQDRAGQRIHRDLTEAAHAWQAQHREPSHLFGGTRLAVARDWAASHGPDLNPDERAFLAACQQRERRTTRLRRAAAAALAVLTLVSAVTAGLAVHDNSQAVKARNQAITNQVAAEAEQLQATDPSLAAQLDLVNRRLDPTPDNTSRLLSIASIPLSNPLTGPTGPIDAVAYSRGGHTLAAGSTDGAIWLWNVTDPAHPTVIGRHPLTANDGGVWSVAFSPDGHTLAVGFYDGTIWLWNVTDPAHPAQIGPPLTGPTNPDPVDSVAFSPDGHTLAAGIYDGTTWLWNVTDPAHPAQIGQPLNGRTGTDNGVWSLAFSPDGHTLGAGSVDGTLRLWNVTDPAQPTQIGLPVTVASSIYSVAFSPDGRTLAVGGIGIADGTIRLWNITDPAHPTAIGQPLTGPAGGVRAVAFSPGGHTLAAGSTDGTVRLWNVTDAVHPTQIGPPLTGAASPVYSVAFSRDGHTLAVGSADGTIRLWNLPSTVLTYDTGSVYSVAFSPDGHTLAAAGGLDGVVRLWDVTGPARPTQIGHALTGAASPVYSVAFSPGGHTLAAGDADGVVRLWNVTDPARPTQIGHAVTGAASPVYSVAFSPGGHTLAAGGLDTVIWLWKVTDPAHPTVVGQLTGSNNPVESVAFSPDGHTLAAGIKDGTILLWDVTFPASNPVGSLNTTTDAVDSVAFSPDGHTLAAGSYDDTIWLWNVNNPAHATKIGQPLIGPTDRVYSVAFSPNRHTLAAGSTDGAVWLWNVTDPVYATQIGSLTGHTGPVYSVALSPNGHTLAAGSADSTIRLWNLDAEQAIDRICATTSANLTPKQWARYIPQLPYDPPCRHL
jgi:WD40 repeat protein